MWTPSSIIHSLAGVGARIGWIVAAIFLFSIFAVTGLAALYFYLRQYLQPPEAMGLIAVIAGFASLVAGWWATSRHSEPKHDPVSETALLETMVSQAIAKDPLGSVLGALAAGVVLESVPELAHLVRRALGQRP